MDTGRACQLPPYPGPDGTGPVILQYLEDQGTLAACGSYYYGDQFCFSLGPETAVWQSMPPMAKKHCPFPWGTQSHVSANHGWFVIGQEYCFNNVISSEIFASINDDEDGWKENVIDNPTILGYPKSTCTVQLDDSRVMVIGGYDGVQVLTNAWILNLKDMSWSQTSPMPTPKGYQGCVLTPNGDVLSAGGWDGEEYNPSAFLYSPNMDSWRQVDNLPSNIKDYMYPRLMQWKDKLILLEYKSQRIWVKENLSWELMETGLGAEFRGGYDTAVLVPEDKFKC